MQKTLDVGQTCGLSMMFQVGNMANGIILHVLVFNVINLHASCSSHLHCLFVSSMSSHISESQRGYGFHFASV